MKAGTRNIEKRFIFARLHVFLLRPEAFNKQYPLLCRFQAFPSVREKKLTRTIGVTLSIGKFVLLADTAFG